MTGERLTGIDQGTLLAEQMLGNEEVLRTLIAGGQSKDVILQRIVSDLGNDPVGQACFLRTLFRNMAREGNATVTDRRDGALAILTDATITPLVAANPTIVSDSYIEAVQQQTREKDPFSGSIDTLLEAGKAIAPHLSQDAQRRQQIITEWERVAEQFLTDVYKRIHIRSKLEEIKERISPISVFDTQVEKLKKAGLTNRQIAKQLERKPAAIWTSVHRLKIAGRLERLSKGRSVDKVYI